MRTTEPNSQAPPGEEGSTTPPEINGETEVRSEVAVTSQGGLVLLGIMMTCQAERLMRLEAEQRCVEASGWLRDLQSNLNGVN